MISAIRNKSSNSNFIKFPILQKSDFNMIKVKKLSLFFQLENKNSYLTKEGVRLQN